MSSATPRGSRETSENPTQQATYPGALVSSCEISLRASGMKPPGFAKRRARRPTMATAGEDARLLIRSIMPAMRFGSGGCRRARTT